MNDGTKSKTMVDYKRLVTLSFACSRIGVGCSLSATAKLSANTLLLGPLKENIMPFLSTPVSDLMMLYHLMTSEVYCVLNELQHTHVLSKISVLNPQSQMKQPHMTHLVLIYHNNILP
jgi:hypothetical protein